MAEERVCYVCGKPITSAAWFTTQLGSAHLGFNDVHPDDVPEDELWLYHAIKPCGNPLPVHVRKDDDG